MNAAPTTTNILETLWAGAAGNLDINTQRWVAESTDNVAKRMVVDLAATVSGIGCLVANDQEAGGAGNFQSPHDLPELLHGIAHSLDTIGGLMAIGSRAREALADPEAHKMQAKLIGMRKGGAQ